MEVQLKTNSLPDTLATLGKDARHLVEMVLHNSREHFERDGEVAPILFASTPDGKFTVIPTRKMMGDQLKPALREGMRALRQVCPVVGFLSEVWMVKPPPGDTNFDPVTKTCKVMPRDDPTRTECVMFQLWEGRRTVSFMAEITRHPNQMGEWVVMFDSFFPVKDGQFDGRSHDGGRVLLPGGQLT